MAAQPGSPIQVEVSVRRPPTGGCLRGCLALFLIALGAGLALNQCDTGTAPTPTPTMAATPTAWPVTPVGTPDGQRATDAPRADADAHGAACAAVRDGRANDWSDAEQQWASAWALAEGQPVAPATAWFEHVDPTAASAFNALLGDASTLMDDSEAAWDTSSALTVYRRDLGAAAVYISGC